MKTRNLISLAVIAFFCTATSYAADRVVQMAGPAGTYSSISAAITAAADGDNIVINNRTDALPWLESLTIDKSLTFVSAADNVQWWMEGTISITLAEGRTITIVGMRNSSATGNISKTGTIPTNRTVLNILSSDIKGQISVANGIDFYLGSSVVDATITYSYGRLLGNSLRSVICNADVATEDVNEVIGNHIAPYTGAVAFIHTNNTQYLHFGNNYGRGSAAWGIAYSAWFNIYPAFSFFPTGQACAGIPVLF